MSNEQSIEQVIDDLCTRHHDTGGSMLVLGQSLDARDTDKQLMLDRAINKLLRIRTKSGQRAEFTLNAAQKQLSANWGERNIVLKARQLGITTYVAARFFLQTITQPGTLSVQVAHDQEAAEEIFRIVHRYLENLPAGMRSELRTSRSNVRQIVFPRIEAVANKDVVDSDAFTAGLGKIIDGVVQCLNASVWAKAK